MKNLKQFLNESLKLDALKISGNDIETMDMILDKCADDLDYLEGQKPKGLLKRLFIDICKENHIKYNKDYVKNNIIGMYDDAEDILWEVTWYRHGRADNCKDKDIARLWSNELDRFISSWFNAIQKSQPEVFKI